MIRRSRAAWALLVGLSVHACGDASTVSNDEQSGEAPEWLAEETLSIGSVDDPEQALVSVGGVRLGADGRIHVVQARDYQIRVYGPDGQLLTRIGRQGEGPGEFMSINGIGLRGDTLYASDFRLNRLSFFAPDGTFLTSQQWAPQRIAGGPVQGGTVAFITSAPQVLLSDGSGLSEPGMRVAVSGAAPPRAPARVATPRVLVRVASDASVLD